MYKYKKSYERLNTFVEGNNTKDFWEWYFRTKFKEWNELMHKTIPYYDELKMLYIRLLGSKESSLNNLEHEKYIMRHNANGLLNQLAAIETIFKEDGIELI